MRRLGLVLPLILVVVACRDASEPGTQAATGGSATDTSEAGSGAALSATIDLSATTVRAGSAIDAELVVQNDTGSAIQADGCGSLFAIALASEDYEPTVAWPDCLQRLTVPEGRSVYEFEVLASHLGCDAGPSLDDAFPRCADDGGLPALPPGTYEARLYQSSTVIPDVPAVAVQVTG